MPDLNGPWNQAQVDEHVRHSIIPMRLGVQLPSGFPAVVSLWFLPEDGAYWAAVHQDAKITAWLRRDSKVAFEIAADQPPYCGVRGQAIATLVKDEGERVLRAVIDRYLGDQSSDLARWLLSRVDEEWAIRIQPRRQFTWDYAGRMKGIHFDRP